MKKTLKLFLVFGLAITFALNVQAQDEPSSSWDTGLDIYSSYIWRGSKFGNGVAFQPYVEFSTGDFALGAWGSVASGGASGPAYLMTDDAGDDYIDIPSSEGYEMDLYASYSIGAFSLTVTDYFFGGDWTAYKSNHYLEPSLGVSAGDFSFTAAYMFLPQTDDVKWGKEGDTYLEAGYSFGSFDVAVGAGDGQYTAAAADESKAGDFNICALSVGTSKDIQVTDTWTLPVSGSVILNPTTGGFFITAGISF